MLKNSDKPLLPSIQSSSSPTSVSTSPVNVTTPATTASQPPPTTQSTSTSSSSSSHNTSPAICDVGSNLQQITAGNRGNSEQVPGMVIVMEGHAAQSKISSAASPTRPASSSSSSSSNSSISPSSNIGAVSTSGGPTILSSTSILTNAPGVSGTASSSSHLHNMPSNTNSGSNQNPSAINPMSTRDDLSDSEPSVNTASVAQINSKNNKSTKSNNNIGTVTTIKREIDSSPLPQTSLSNSNSSHNIQHHTKKENSLRLNINSNNKNNNNHSNTNNATSNTMMDNIIGPTNTGSLSQHHNGSNINHIKRSPDSKAGVLNDDLASLTSYSVQQHDSSLIKVEDNPSDHLMTGDSFSNSINTNQPNSQLTHPLADFSFPIGSRVSRPTRPNSQNHQPDINQQQMPSQQVNLNSSNRMTPTPTDSVPIQQQPLITSAMGNKTGGNNGGSMEYTQQQSHIFVFSTALANEGAEAVRNGIHISIVAFHCAQPGTKKFLEKHPLKPTQLNRPNPTAQWLNNFSNTKSKSNLRGAGGKPGNNNHPLHGLPQHQPQPPLHPNMQPSLGFPGGNSNASTDEIMSNADADLLSWDQQNMDALANGNPNSSSGMLVSSCGTTTSTQALTTSGPHEPSGPASLLSDGSGLDVDSLVPGSPLSGRLGNNIVPLNPKGTCVPPNLQSPTSMGNLPQGAISPNMLNSMKPSSLQGVKVPDENLTPQQLQHREEQLAKIKQMNQIFFGEQGGPNPNIPNNLGVPGGMPINHTAGMIGPQSGNPAQMMGMQQQMHNPYNHPIQEGPNQNQQQMMGMGPMMPGPMGQSKIPNQHMMGNAGNANSASMEWKQMQSQYFEEQRIKNEDGSFRFGGPSECNNYNMGSGMGSPGPMSAQRQMNQAQMRQNPVNKPATPIFDSSGNFPPGTLPANDMRGYARSQGPPPPYHQTQRSASVPIATQSPNPNSPNNPTSNLSLPSPRGGTALDSPAEPHHKQHQHPQQQQQFKHLAPGQSPTSMDSIAGMGNNMQRSMNHSNPTTPLSSHLSPNTSLKELELGNNHNNSGKEINLMPVPSPQQIQYLNTFEGQELTIQKQPNTNINNENKMSPSVDGTFGHNQNQNNMRGAVPISTSGGNNQTNMDVRMSTPLDTPSGQTPLGPNDKIISRPGGPSPQGARGPNCSAGNVIMEQSISQQQSSVGGGFPPSSPGMVSTAPNSGSTGNINFSSPIQMNAVPLGHTSEECDGHIGPFVEGLPINSNVVNKRGAQPNTGIQQGQGQGQGKNVHFDPITSLTQMSNLLTNNSGGFINGQPSPGVFMPGSRNIGFMNSPHRIHGMNENQSNINSPNSGMQPHHMQQQQPLHHMQQQDCSMPGMAGSPMDCGVMGGMNPAQFPGPMHNQMNPHTDKWSNMGNNGQQGGQQRSISPPKLGSGNFPGNQMPPRMMNRSMSMNLPGSPYNNANIQIKADAPNTIQYLPARSQMGGNNPRGPLRIEFLQRYANPMVNQMEGNKMGGMGGMGGFYPNCNQMGLNSAGPPQSNDMRMNPHMDRMMDGSMGPIRSAGQEGIGPMDGIGVPPHPHTMGGAQGSMMMRPLRPPNQMCMPGPPSGPHMGGPNMPGRGGNNHMFNGPSNDAGMFMPPQQMRENENFCRQMVWQKDDMGGKGNRLMGGMPPDASQPLPSPMSGPNNVNNGGANQQNFKTGQFMGPNSNEPRFDESFLKFQQELYATSTGNQMNSQQPPAQPPPQAMENALNQNQQFFGNKKFT